MKEMLYYWMKFNEASIYIAVCSTNGQHILDKCYKKSWYHPNELGTKTIHEDSHVQISAIDLKDAKYTNGSVLCGIIPAQHWNRNH